MLLIVLSMSACTFQHGTTRDIVQGYDSGILWNHMYLKNDHTTVYCFEKDTNFSEMFDESQRTQKEIIVTYETYLLKGSLCYHSEKFDGVVVKDVKFV